MDTMDVKSSEIHRWNASLFKGELEHGLKASVPEANALIAIGSARIWNGWTAILKVFVEAEEADGTRFCTACVFWYDKNGSLLASSDLLFLLHDRQTVEQKHNGMDVSIRIKEVA